MNPPQVYMCSPSWTLLPPPTPFHPSGSSQCTSPKMHFKKMMSKVYGKMKKRSVQSLSHVQLFATLWTAARQASLSITNSRSPPKPMSVVLGMPSNHLVLCRPFFLLPSIFPSIRVFSNESALRIRWPKHWSFSIGPSNEYAGLISFRIDWFDLLAVQGTLKLGHFLSSVF